MKIYAKAVRGMIVVLLLLSGAMAVWWVVQNHSDRVSVPEDVDHEYVLSSSKVNDGEIVDRPSNYRKSDASQGSLELQKRSNLGLTMDELLTPGGVSMLSVALSLEEATWKDRHGVPRGGEDSPYESLTLEQLEQKAKAGDVGAATLAARRHRMTAWQSIEGQELLGPSPPAKGRLQLESSEAMALREKFLRMAETPEWEAYRKFLWIAVVHGSSWAAGEIGDSYEGPFLTCFVPVKCDAWVLVAWRMGEWNIHFSRAYVYPDGTVRDASSSLGANVRQANRLWNEINTARTEIGLPPLQIDLRPSYDRWMELETDGHIDGPIFRR